MEESVKKGLYYNVNKRKKAGTSRPKGHPLAPSEQDWRDAAKTAKKEERMMEQTKNRVKIIKGKHALSEGVVCGTQGSWVEVKLDAPANEIVYLRKQMVRPIDSLREGKLYYHTTATAPAQLKESFGMERDSKGWYLAESAGRRLHMQAFRAFGAPKIIR